MSERANRDGNGVAIAHERLRKAILTGQLRGGEVLSQARLSEIVDAGRTPLREALRMLQHEGLVVSDPKRRIRIAELSASAAFEVVGDLDPDYDPARLRSAIDAALSTASGAS